MPLDQEVSRTVVPAVANEILRTANEATYMTRKQSFEAKIQKTTAFAIADVDGMLSYVPLSPGESAGSFGRKPKKVRLIVKRILQEYINGVTGLPTTRSVPNYSDFSLDEYLKFYDPHRIQTQTEIAGTVAVRPVWEAGQVYYRLHDASELIPIVDPKSGRLYALGINYTEGNKKHLEVWTPETVTFFEDGRVTLTTLNPYNTIPFSIFRASNHPTSFWGISDLSPICENNNTINKMLMDEVQLATDQSYSIYVYMGPLPESEDRAEAEGQVGTEPIKIGTGRILTLPENGKLSTVTPDASLEEVHRIIEGFTREAFEDAMVFVLERNSEYSSGFSVVVKKGPYLRRMATKRELFIKADQRLLELAVLTKDVALNGPSDLRPDFKVRTQIDPSSLTPETSQERTEKDKFLLDQSAITVIDLIVQENNVTREEAIQIYNRNQTEPKGSSPAQ